MGDPQPLAVHRCRFVDFTPSAITAIAFPPLPLPTAKAKTFPVDKQPLRFGTLAVGHANGNIDLCEWTGEHGIKPSTQAWAATKTLSGPYPSKVDSLAFVIRHPDRISYDRVPSSSDLRLFSSGGGSELLEWDIERGVVRRTISSQGGAIWSISANPASNILALGCEDGTVRLVSLLHDTLTHFRRFDRVKSRLLSIAWGPPVPRQASVETAGTTGDSSDSDDEEDDWTDSWLVTGGSDSSLRKWDVATGRVLDKMGTDKIRGERTLVWSVGVLGDGTIISGDSMGMVKFWDSRTCTQLQSFQGHGADVLCLTVSPEGSTVYTSGVDQKISQFSFVKTSEPNERSSLLRASSRWVHSSSRRIHSHDVRALGIWPPYTVVPPAYRRQFPMDIAPILASGGLDMSVVLTPAAIASNTAVKILNPLLTSIESTFEDSYHRRLSYNSGPSSTTGICVSRRARLISCIRDAGLSVWRISPKKYSLDEAEEHLERDSPLDNAGWERVLEMEFDLHTNVTASAISSNGRWLVVSDMYETKLFSIESDSNGDSLKPKRIRDFTSTLQAHLPASSVSTGALSFTFSPDSSKLVMTTAFSSHVLVIHLGIEGEKPRVLRKFDHHRAQNTAVRILKGRKNDQDVAMTDANESETEDTITKPALASILRTAISADGQWLATSDDCSRTHIFNLDSIQHHCVLPSFPLAARSISFDPTRPNLLILAFPNNSLQIYNVETRQFPPWSRDLCNGLPRKFTHVHDPVVGVTFDPASTETPSGAPSYALFWGSTWICKIPLEGSVDGSGGHRKRRRESKKLAQKFDGNDEHHRDIKMITHYRPILHVDFIGAGELVVIERPLVDILATLPPAYFKHKYGTA